MRSSMSMLYASTVSVTAANRITAPSEKFTASSASRSCAPSARAMGSLTGNDVMSYGMPAMKFVDVVAKYCCCSDGARKPVCAEPRSANESVKS